MTSGQTSTAVPAPMGLGKLGGLITETIERIPVAGDSINWRGYRVEVLSASRRRARLIRIRKDADDG